VFDRSSLTRWRQRMGEEKLRALLQESLAVATRTQAMKPSDLARVVIDTTVQPKAVMFPTDAKLLNRARERLVRLAKKLGVSLRQSYRRVGQLALIKHQRYSLAHQFKCANRSLPKLKTYLGRIVRNIERHIAGNEVLREAFVRPLFLARRVLEQERLQRGRKVYSLHAPEVENADRRRLCSDVRCRPRSLRLRQRHTRGHTWNASSEVYSCARTIFLEIIKCRG
jgi:transposase, IS5 family